MAKKSVLAVCDKIAIGHLVIEDGEDVYTFGEPLSRAAIHAHITVHHPSAYYQFVMHGTLGSGEGYMAGSWSTPDLLNVIRLMVKNLEMLNAFDQRRPWFTRLAGQLFHLLNINSRTGSKKNIAAHYDLGNDFFRLFLDSSMMYSAAIYPDNNADLETAAEHKLESICRKLELTPDDHLLEIGSGWGGMAIYAAAHYGCRVTTTTISREQYDYTLARVKAEGLEKRITVLLKDYRDLDGQYDKLVSIEMVEAVGHRFYRQYFSRCSQLLRPGGLMLLQAITIPDQRYDYARVNTDFIKKYIFPGGCLPSNDVIARNIARYTDMQIVDLQDITEHYADTLADWYQRFESSVELVKALGFDDQFVRMWEFYLRYCEGGFRERAISTSQILMAKPGYRFPR